MDEIHTCNPAPSFPLSWPCHVYNLFFFFFLHLFYFPVVLISSCQFSQHFNKMCALWIKRIVIFITTSHPLETITQLSFHLHNMSALCFLSLCFFPFWLLFSFYSVSAAPSAKTGTWGSDANIKTFHPGRPTSEPMWRMTQLRSWHRRTHHLATH